MRESVCDAMRRNEIRGKRKVKKKKEQRKEKRRRTGRVANLGVLVRNGGVDDIDAFVIQTSAHEGLEGGHE